MAKLIDTAGASPNQANPEHIVDLDMVGTGYAVDAFGKVMAEGGAGLIISSQAAYIRKGFSTSCLNVRI